MSYSKLTNIYVPASTSNYSKGRAGKRILKITPHHVAGNPSIETLGRWYQDPKWGSSANYGIGSDGRIACYVNEEDRAWTSSSPSNDNQAITIEVANNTLAPNWTISDVALSSLIMLCVDICQRYGFKLVYDNTPNGSLTRHNMFANTACPGPYLQSKFPYIVEQVNKQLGPSPAPTPTTGTEYRVQLISGRWLPWVKGVSDYAGLYGNRIRAYQVRDKIYQSHILNGPWLPYVNGTNGFSGQEPYNNKPINGIRIKNAEYRVHLEGYGWLDWVNGESGYAGQEPFRDNCIDGIQIR